MVPGVIGVSDTDQTSSPTTAGNRSLGAPGTDALTLTPGGGFDYVSGASMSAAMATGVVALALEQNAALGGTAMRELLERTADKTGPARVDQLRQINACDAIAAVAHQPACTPARTARTEGP